MKVTVSSARTAQPSTRPVSAHNPEGRSTAITGRPLAFSAVITDT